MVDALLAAEDKRFFEHGGFDIFRIVGAAWADLRKGAVAQGASTLDMQVARSFFFSSERTFRRENRRNDGGVRIGPSLHQAADL